MSQRPAQRTAIVTDGGVAPIRRVAVVGCGTIGASWAAFFLAHGLDVVATDPAPNAEDRLRAFVARATHQLRELGASGDGRLSFVGDLGEAVASADFVQENGPDAEAAKIDLLAAIDRAAPPAAIVATSTSSQLRSRIVAECRHPERHIVAHPFNPPHLIPLVEIVGGADWAVAKARAFYASLGKKPIVLRREMRGHIANRLTSALWREAVHLVEQEVASVADIDDALRFGPGLRWALMGAHLTYHLGGGEGGIRNFLDHLGPGHELRWRDLGSDVRLTEDLKTRLTEGVLAEAGDRSIEDLERERDAKLIALLRLVAEPRLKSVSPRKHVGGAVGED